jgi:hypothetical protein
VYSTSMFRSIVKIDTKLLLCTSQDVTHSRSLHFTQKMAGHHLRSFPHKKHTIITMAPPSNNHAITHNSTHRWAMAFKPVLISSLHPRASTDVSASSVPLSFQCPQPSSITNLWILDFHLS